LFSWDHIKEYLSDKRGVVMDWLGDYGIIIPTSLGAWFLGTSASPEIIDSVPTEGDYQLVYAVIAIVTAISRITYKWRSEIKSLFAKNKKGDKKHN